MQSQCPVLNLSKLAVNETVLAGDACGRSRCVGGRRTALAGDVRGHVEA